uniref:Uncharacterized protein n=1 Tax=Malurus cyaneus samueli TaxID=2593467 RepID=A0A8C5U220_9PASS
MGDAAKSYFAKQNKEQEIQEESKGSPLQKGYQVMDEYGSGYSNKIDTSLQNKKGTPAHYGSSPRRGPRSVLSSPNSLKNTTYSQGAKLNDTQKDLIKKWISDDHHSTSDTWREYRSVAWIPGHGRTRKDSFHEVEGAGNRSVRRQLQEDLMSKDVADTQKGSSGNFVSQYCISEFFFCCETSEAHLNRFLEPLTFENLLRGSKLLITGKGSVS